MTNDEQSGNASPFKGKTGLARLWRALFYSRDGLRAAYRHEDAFRQEAWLALALVPLAFVMPVGNLGRALMIASIMLVLIVELVVSCRKSPSVVSPLLAVPAAVGPVLNPILTNEVSVDAPE